MNSIDIMVKEHENILAFLEAVKVASLEIIEGAEPDTEDFRKMIDFVENYADGHHHGKEEKFFLCICLSIWQNREKSDNSRNACRT